VSDPDPRPARPHLELADVLRRHADDYICRRDGHLDRVQRRVMSAIVACRTAVLGGHVETCTACRASRVAYNSCRNRHCPKCQGGARTRWLAARERELLPVPYFHVVFTVPAPIGAIAFQNKAVVYAILFKAAAEAMTTLAANPRRLGAEIGAVAVLHTWGQALNHHPHLHCVVPGGGLAPDDARWVQGRANFFLAVKPLARLFRRLFLERLAAAFDKGELRFFSDLAALADRERFAGHLASLRRIDWVVYAKKPFGGPAQVLAYLGRYTHRVAIANSRLVSCDQHHVAFTWKDYRQGGTAKVMRLTPDEFIRRFLLHTLPDGFHRIRHLGFLANGHRAAKLALARALLKPTSETEPADAPSAATNKSAYQPTPNRDAPTSPICGGIVRVTSHLAAGSKRLGSAAAFFQCDTS